MIADNPGIVSSSFGQKEPLTRRLRGLIRDYPMGVGIFQEFVQNADDAGATTVRFVMDWQHHKSQDHLEDALRRLMGPALLVYNNSIFTPEDFANIQEIGKGGKLTEGAKTGRFGLGFNTAYNITDYPVLLSCDQLSLFDPHYHGIARDNSPGWGLTLNDALWEHGPSLLTLFDCVGLKTGDTDFDGTVFRLPLRDTHQAQRSEIKHEPFTADDFGHMMEQLQALGSQILVFLKHVVELEVVEVDAQGNSNTLYAITSANRSEVEGTRRAVVSYAQGSTEEVIDKLSGDASPPFCCYEHQFDVTQGITSKREHWMVANGFVLDDGGDLLDTARAMTKHDEKAMPWVGAACRVDAGDDGLLPVPLKSGRAFCFLPLGEVALPLLVNGFFDLDSTRQALTVESKDTERARWNHLLVCKALGWAYAELVERLTDLLAPGAISPFYALWPTTSLEGAGVWSSLPDAVMEELSARAVVRTGAGENIGWGVISDLYVLPADRPGLQKPLFEEGMPIPNPPLPPGHLASLRRFNRGIDDLTPSKLREQLRVKSDVDCEMGEGPRVCLGRREWVLELWRYCQSDSPGKDLIGLPLAIMSDGRLHTVGRTEVGYTFLGGDMEYELFAERPEYFLDDTFVTEAKVEPNSDAGIVQMDASHVVKLVGEHLGLDEAECVPWDPEGETIPNAKWLALLFKFLGEQPADRLAADSTRLASIGLIPDQHRQLWSVKSNDTPLLADRAAGDKYGDMLRAFKIPVVSGKRLILDAIRQFEKTFPNTFLRRVSGRDLIDTLASVAESKGLPEAYDPTAHDVLLDFLTNSLKKPDADTFGARVRADVLRALRVFPTTQGSLSTLDEVYVPDDFTPPAYAGDVTLLERGPNEAWATLFKALDIPTLTRDRLIKDFLLPGFTTLDAPQQREALQWIRDNLSAAEADLECTDVELVGVLRNDIKNASLVRCTDGTIQQPSRIYDPTDPMARDVLGNEAHYPDLAFYGGSAESWLGFFRDLGMSARPRAADMLRYVDGLIDEAEEAGTAPVRDRIVAVLRFLSLHWDEYGDTTVPDDGDECTLGHALSSRYWLPARIDGEIGRTFFAGAPAEDRLYSPDEVFVPRLGHLVASHAPIADVGREPTQRMFIVLGMPGSVTIDDVMQHFDEVISKWSDGEENKLGGSVLPQTLRSIYMEFGKYFRTATQGVESERFDAAATLDTIRSHYEGNECLWSNDAKGFVTSDMVFAECPACLREWRTHGHIPEDAVRRGYYALGMRERPEASDFIRVLEEIQQHVGESELNDQQRLSVRRIIKGLCEPLEVEKEVWDDVPVLTSGGILTSSSTVYADDAPWISERLIPNALNLLDADCWHDPLIRWTEMSRLSECVTEKPTGIRSASKNKDFIARCRLWQDTLRSDEFINGLRRLVRHEHGFDREGEFMWLKSVHVEAVGELSTKLVVQNSEESRIVGESVTDAYFEPDISTFVVSEGPDLYLPLFLTKALNRQLDDGRLKDCSALEKILQCGVSNIDSELTTRLHIPSLPGADVGTVEDENDQEPMFAFLHPDVEPVDEAKDEEGLDAEEGDDGSGKSSGESTYTGGERVGTDTATGATASRRTGAGGDLDGDDEDDESKGTAQRPTDTGSSDSGGGGSGSGKRRAPREVLKGADAVNAALSTDPPVEPGDGKSRGGDLRSGHGGWSKRRGAGVGVGPGKPRKKMSAEAQAERERVGKKGEERIRELEEQELGWACTMPDRNKGYDVISGPRRGEIAKYIEVKSLKGSWDGDVISLTSPEFLAALDFKEEYWLYVVEHVLDDDHYKITRIQDPATQAGGYEFDTRWRSGTNTGTPATGPTAPTVGDWIEIDDVGVGQVADVSGLGVLKRLKVTFDDAEQDLLFHPATMRVVSNAEGAANGSNNP